MSLFNSLINADKFINEKNSIVGLLHVKGNEQSFLMTESVNAFDQIMLTKYTCTPDLYQTDKFKIEIDQRTIKPEDAKQAFLDMLNNDSNVLGKSWPITKNQEITLHQNIQQSKQNPGNHNPLGNASLAPMTGNYIGALPDHTEEIATGVVAGTVGYFGCPQGAAMITAGQVIYKNLPDKTKEQIKEGMYNSVESVSGPEVSKIINSSSKPSGHNSFTWAREILLSLNDHNITRTLPREIFDLFDSVTSRHLDKTEDEKVNTKCNIM